jgi:hypothetical protein
MYSIIVTAKLNDVDPQAWLADVLTRVAGHRSTGSTNSYSTAKNVSSHMSILKLALRSHGPGEARAKLDGAGREDTPFTRFSRLGSPQVNFGVYRCAAAYGQLVLGICYPLIGGDLDSDCGPQAWRLSTDVR